MVEAWRPIQDESLEDYESQFISIFDGTEDPPEELEETELVGYSGKECRNRF